jgi:5'-nucleotidase
VIVEKYEGRLDEAPGIVALMRPLPGAINAFDTYIRSTAPWRNPSGGSTSSGCTNASIAATS